MIAFGEKDRQIGIASGLHQTHSVVNPGLHARLRCRLRRVVIAIENVEKEKSRFFSDQND